MALAEQLAKVSSQYVANHPFSSVVLSDRASVQALLRTLLNPLLPFFSPKHALVRVPGATGVLFDDVATQIEGYARPLWGLASLLAGEGDYDAAGVWIDGLRSGTDPSSDEFWGLSADTDQRMVEMCCLGYTLAVAPQFWEKLSATERVNVETYLGSCNNK